MFWHQRLAQWLVSDRLADLSERVAGRSRLAVWQRVSARLATLGASESRGYVRARAIAVVQAETDRLIEQDGPRVAALRERIIAAAIGTLVETIVGQVQEQRRAGRRVAA